MSKIRILLADDHQIVRQGMKALLNAQPNMEVIGEASDGFDLIEMVDKLMPNVVITDIAMPNMNGIEATLHIKRRNPNTQVIILSMHSTSSYVVGALRSGAMGFLLKNDDYLEVVHAIQAVSSGKRYMSSQVSNKLLDTFLEADGYMQVSSDLTEREREVLQLIAEGNTSQQIADKLNISIRTAEKHRANLRAKIGANSQADLIHYAIQNGIVNLKE